jgi:hypothetical protein
MEDIMVAIPNVAKVFLWGACKNILLTKENLCKRGVIKEDTCIFCQRETETVCHILWECPLAKDVWSACDRRMQKSQGSYGSFMEVLEVVTGRCVREEINLFALIAKRIWSRRNSMMHGGVFLHPNRIVCEVKEMLVAFLTHAKDVMVGRRSEETLVTVKWEKPPFGRFKLSWDVAFDKLGQCICAGAVIRDHNGYMCDAKSMKIDGNQTPVMGEALTAIAVMEFCKERGIQDVILEGDSCNAPRIN